MTGGSTDFPCTRTMENNTKKERNYSIDMTTLEMMNEAQITKKTYISGNNLTNMRYSVSKGFHDEDGKKWDGYAFKYVNDIFEIDVWKLIEPKKMTIKQIEEELGYDIELVSNV